MSRLVLIVHCGHVLPYLAGRSILIGKVEPIGGFQNRRFIVYRTHIRIE
nr:MAG TPA: hypothetical protein [Caudoviricetes sp.]